MATRPLIVLWGCRRCRLSADDSEETCCLLLFSFSQLLSAQVTGAMVCHDIVKASLGDAGCLPIARKKPVASYCFHSLNFFENL